MERQLTQLRVQYTFKTLLLFLGVLLMQFLGYLLCVGVFFAYHLRSGETTSEISHRLGTLLQSGSSFMIVLSIVTALLNAMWCAVLYRRSPWRDKDIIYSDVFSKQNLLGLLTLAMGSCIFFSIAITIVAAILPDMFQTYEHVMKGLDANGSIITVLYVLLIGPVSEELIFRGAILDRLKVAYPFWLANTMQAALFGVYHANLVQGLYAFCLGMLLGVVGAVTGSIFCTILTHIIFNATSYGLGILFPNTGNMSVSVALFILLLGMLLFIFGLNYYIRKYKEIQKKFDT